MIRTNDSALSSVDNTFFDNDDQNSPNSPEKDQKTPKPVKKPLKIGQVIASQLQQQTDPPEETPKITPTESQKLEELKQNFINAAKQSETNSEEFFQISKSQPKSSDDHKIISNQPDSNRKDNGQMFLDDYFDKEYWRGEEDRNSLPMFKQMGNVSLNDSADETDLKHQEDFEIQHNYRFEENGGTNLITYSRDQPDSLREVKETARKKRRAQKKEKIRQKKNKLQEEAKKLVRLKEKKLSQKLKQIQQIAGVKKLAINARDLDSDFDQKSFEEKMSQIFGDGFYQEEESLGEDQEDNEGLEEEKQIQLTKKFEEIEKDLAVNLNAHLKSRLEEPGIGGFNYIKVKPKSYGMSAEEILGADDKELRRKVSLKFMAPYRDDKDGENWVKKREDKNIDNRFVRSEKIVKKEMRKRKRQREEEKRGKRQKEN